MDKEYEVDWAHLWVEVGSAGIGPGGGTGVVESGISLCLVLLSLSDYSFTVSWLSLAFVTDPFSLFQGLHLLRHCSFLREKAQKLEAEGLQKVELAVAGSEAVGLYRLLRGALSHSTMSSAPPHLKDIVMPLPPLYPRQPLRHPQESNLNPLLLQLREVDWHRRPLLGCLPSLRGSHPHPYETPLPRCGGHQKSY